MSQNLVISTAEPFFIPGNRVGCLLVHGFTGTPKEMRMLADSLACEGYTILGVRLTGHATNIADMHHSNWQDWLASVEDGLNLLKGCTDQQIVMGLSMGGILSLIAAARYPVAGVVTFSAPIHLPPDPRVKFLPVLRWLVPYVAKGKPDWRNLDAMQDHVDYPLYPTRSVMQLQKLIEVMQTELSNVKVPALLVQSKNDTSIPPDSINRIFSEIASTEKTRMWIENSGHVVIREPAREQIFADVKKFIQRIVSTK